jgi:hypothetical protein
VLLQPLLGPEASHATDGEQLVATAAAVATLCTGLQHVVATWCTGLGHILPRLVALREAAHGTLKGSAVWPEREAGRHHNALEQYAAHQLALSDLREDVLSARR